MSEAPLSMLRKGFSARDIFDTKDRCSPEKIDLDPHFYLQEGEG
jgi:hypothetical protein